MIWVDIAVDALNKQIPEKLEMAETNIYKTDGVVTENCLVCPRCKHKVDVKHTADYWSYCGKALDLD